MYGQMGYTFYSIRNNYARNDMTVNDVTVTGTATDKNGAGITGNYNSQGWWENPANSTPPGGWFVGIEGGYQNLPTAAWDFTNVWYWDDRVNENLPKLRGVGGQ
jgi:hypothetical protein